QSTPCDGVVSFAPESRSAMQNWTLVGSCDMATTIFMIHRDPMSIILKLLSTRDLARFASTCSAACAIVEPHWRKRNRRLLLELRQVAPRDKRKGRRAQHVKWLHQLLVEHLSTRAFVVHHARA